MKEMQSELNFLSRQSAMSTMAAVLAHEINQPLTAITNYASGLRRIAGAEDPASPISQGLAEIETSALRAGDIIRRMRAIAQRGEVKKEQIDFDGLARSAVRFAGIVCEGTSIAFDCRAKGLVLADRIQIEQVLVNLVKNACEAMEGADEKLATISTADGADCVTICISDTGPGIAPDPHLFEAAVSGKAYGMGIGLSICRTIVEAHHGRIWVERPSRGARFCFSLPKADTA
jgi:two-component system sensor kinase FixL